MLTAAERQARFDAAVAQANAIPVAARTPITIAVVALLGLLTVPFLLRRRAAARATGVGRRLGRSRGQPPIPEPPKGVR